MDKAAADTDKTDDVDIKLLYSIAFLRGHRCWLQNFVSLVLPLQGFPFRRARILMVLSRVRKPPPQLLLQSDHVLYSVYSQSTGGPEVSKGKYFSITVKLHNPKA
jgi:hypothetical protein